MAIVVPFCYFPSFYASNGNPPARSLIVPGSMLIAWAVLSGKFKASVNPTGRHGAKLPDSGSLPMTPAQAQALLRRLLDAPLSNEWAPEDRDFKTQAAALLKSLERRQ